MQSDPIAWETVTVRLGDLIPWEDNPRQMTADQAERLQKSIDKYGYSQLLEVDADNMYVDGHQRDALFKAVKELGFLPNTKIEVRKANVPFTVEMRKEYMAWKHEGGAGEWNWDMMPNLFTHEELEEFGIGIPDIHFDLFKDEEPEPDPGAQIDKAEELREKWDVRSGQLWELGNHRLVCGDCTDAEVVEKVMGGERADCTVTDPPYGIGVDYGDFEDTPENIKDLIADVMPIIFEHLPAALTSGQPSMWDYPRPTWVGAWVHPAPVSGCPWGFVGNNPILFYGADPYLKAGKGRRPDSVVMATDRQNENEHPTAKPIKVWEWLVERLTPDKGLMVFDPFLGSGTTMVAAHRLSRRCFGIEINPGYVAVTLERMSGLGITPVLVEELASESVGTR